MYTDAQIADCTGAPVANVHTSWPGLIAALDLYKIDTHLDRIGVIATIARETGSFLPIPEWGTGAEYNWRADLGNIYAGDGERYKGRGFIQLTGRANYATYGARMGLDLVGNPDLALQPAIAAKILCLYWLDRDIHSRCMAYDWQGVQTAVNGGYIGWDRFISVVNALIKVAEPSDKPPVIRLFSDESLRALPREDSADVADLAKGCTMKFTAPAPHDADGLTPHWAFVTLTGGTTQKKRDATGLKGWIRRDNLQQV